MKKLPQHIEDTLLDYLDGNLTAAQREAFEQSLKTNPEWNSRLKEIRLADQAFRNLPLEHPSKNFTQSVMAKLDQYPARSGLSIRNGILLLTGIIVVMAMALMLVSAGVFDETATFDLNNIGLAQRYIKQTLPSIPVDGKLVVKVIILLNMALAFVVLDRAILKPFFQKRMQAGH
jgi:anti-sigma factor RsiW